MNHVIHDGDVKFMRKSQVWYGEGVDPLSYLKHYLGLNQVGITCFKLWIVEAHEVVEYTHVS